MLVQLGKSVVPFRAIVVFRLQAFGVGALEQLDDSQALRGDLVVANPDEGVVGVDLGEFGFVGREDGPTHRGIVGGIDDALEHCGAGGGERLRAGYYGLRVGCGGRGVDGGVVLTNDQECGGYGEGYGQNSEPKI